MKQDQSTCTSIITLNIKGIFMAARLTSLSIVRDINGYPQTQANDARAFSSANQDFTLTASSITTVTVPSFPNANIGVLAYFYFTPNKEVYVLPAAAPTLTVASGTVRETLATINPLTRPVVQGQSIQFLTADTGVTVSISYYAVLTQPGS